MRKLLLVLFLCAGCTDVYNQPPTAPTQTPAPDPVPAPKPSAAFEYRVTGDVDSATIGYSSTIQGASETTSRLPWFASFKSSRLPMFLSLSAQGSPESFGKVTVQIFINGELFRESSMMGFSPRAAIDGTWTGETLRLGLKAPPH